MKHTVALIPLSTYDQVQVDAAVRQGIALLGGIQQFVQPEEKIVLKPNLLNRALPQKAITTHPAVFSAVCRLLREEIKPDLALHGHLHITEVWFPHGERDHLGQPCPAVIGSKPYKKKDAPSHFTGAAITLKGTTTRVVFTDDEGSCSDPIEF